MTTTQQESLEQLAARQVVASALACALADPRSPLARRADGADLQTLEWVWERIVGDTSHLQPADAGIGERLPRDAAITPLIQWLERPAENREPIHQRIFGLVMTKLCPPYETEYCAWKDATHRAQEMADIAGFYRAFGIGPGREAPERFDHVSLEIEFIALLLEKERIAMLNADDAQAGVCREARASFLRDHAGWWMPTFGRLLEKRANDLLRTDEDAAAGLEHIAGVARILCAWMAAERTAAGVAPSRRIVNPTVAPQESEDRCGTCDACDEAIPA